MDGFGKDVGDVGDELLQELAGLLQVGGVDDDLYELGRQKGVSAPALPKPGPCQVKGCQSRGTLA